MTAQVEKQTAVQHHWDAKPCDSDTSAHAAGGRDYFADIEQKRYALQPHVLEALEWIGWADKRVLEIGSGVGTDARQIIARGAVYTGINVDHGSTEMTRRSLRAFGLNGSARQASATDLPFADAAFDVVYSFGVLHHIPAVLAAIDEIRRVLRPGGELLMMVYNRDSINYRVEIMGLRKLLRGLLVVPGMVPALAALGISAEKLEAHRRLAHRHMSDEEWLSRNTDGPENPYSTVYGRAEVEALLQGFTVQKNEVRFFDYRHWGIVGGWLPASVVGALGKRWGWHRMVLARKTD